NSSHEHMVLLDGSHPCYSFGFNDCHQTTELLVRNVSESDLGLYFCALQKKRSSGDGARACSWEDVCHYGNRTTQLSFHGAGGVFRCSNSYVEALSPMRMDELLDGYRSFAKESTKALLKEAKDRFKGYESAKLPYRK
ncbi:hypothetical protein NFI96_030783, partial [Prochilodus magdalenae]